MLSGGHDTYNTHTQPFFYTTHTETGLLLG